jgi:hypothetical protein
MQGAVVLPEACLEETLNIAYSRLHCDPQNDKFTFKENDVRKKVFVLGG